MPAYCILDVEIMMKLYMRSLQYNAYIPLDIYIYTFNFSYKSIYILTLKSSSILEVSFTCSLGLQGLETLTVYSWEWPTKYPFLEVSHISTAKMMLCEGSGGSAAVLIS